eukprot:716350_1
MSTTEDGTTEHVVFDFNAWVADNKFNDIKELFIRYNMTTLASLSTQSTEFSAFIADQTLLRTKSEFIPKIFNAIQTLQTIHHSNPNPTQLVRIVISEEEDNAINQLRGYNANISSSIRELLSLQDKLDDNKKTIESQIETAFTDLVHSINAQKQMLLQELENIALIKTSQIHVRSQSLLERQDITNNVMEMCDKLIQNSDVNVIERRAQIVSMVNDVVHQTVSQNIAAISTDITFTFNLSDIESILAGNISLYGEDQHPIPIINDIECKSIQNTEAKIHFTATMLDQDEHKSVESKLLMKLEICDEEDEKQQEMKPVVCPVLQFDSNKTEYEFHVRRLTENKHYTMEIALYQSHNNQTRKVLNYTPKSIQFQTTSYDWNNTRQLALKGGSGGGGGQRTYTINGISVEASHPVLYFSPNPSYYHMGYMFNGDITTCHPSNQPAGYCGNGHRSSFWLAHAPTENDRNQTLIFTFPNAIKLSYIDVYANIGASWSGVTKYSIDLCRDNINEWSVFCEMVDTTNDILGIKRTHHIRNTVDGVRFNLQTNGSYVVMKQLNFFIIP